MANRGNSKGPNIVDSKMLMEEEYESRNTKLTLRRVMVDNPPGGINPGEHTYLVLQNWYWNNTAGAWMPSKAIWLNYETTEDEEKLRLVAGAIAKELMVDGSDLVEV